MTISSFLEPFLLLSAPMIVGGFHHYEPYTKYLRQFIQTMPHEESVGEPI